MNKKVVFLLISISLNTYSQSELEQKPNKETLLINTLPSELKLHIAEEFLQSIVKKNVVFNPFRGIKEGFKSLISIDKGFFNLRDEIKKDINKFIRNYFASDFINLSKEELLDIYKYVLLEELKIGKIKVKVLHTPGHTPGSVCFLIND